MSPPRKSASDNCGLFDGLNAECRRRLFFFTPRLDDLGTECDLVGGADGTVRCRGGRSNPRERIAHLRRVPYFRHGCGAACGGGGERSSKVDPSKVPRKEFLDAIAAGASNRDLASRFAITPRQANGLRIGLARRKPARADPGSSAKTEDRMAELRQQEEFLRDGESSRPRRWRT